MLSTSCNTKVSTMDKILILLLFVPGVIGQNDGTCNFDNLVLCINAFGDSMGSALSGQADVCPPYNTFIGCVTRLTWCNETIASVLGGYQQANVDFSHCNTVKSTLSWATTTRKTWISTTRNPWNPTTKNSWISTTRNPWNPTTKNSWFPTTPRPWMTTRVSNNGFCFMEVGKCVNDLQAIIAAANGETNTICHVAAITMSCLNYLSSCVDSKEFNDARRIIDDDLGLHRLCPWIVDFPMVAAAPSLQSVTMVSLLAVVLGHSLL